MKTVHFLGIAGSGTSGAACIAQAQGFSVSGCDKDLSSEFFSELEGINVEQGHSPSHLVDVDILAVTPAVLSLDPNNPEILEAKKRKIKVMSWQQFMGKHLMEGKFVIAVCGTHGKSTTTGMIAKILEDFKMDPTVMIGTLVPEWGKNFRVGKSKFFVVEADEYNDNFLAFKPDISIVTNIEYDHPEYFKDFESYKRAFQNFLHETKNLIYANLEDPGTQEVLSETAVKSRFYKPILDYSKYLIDFPLQVIGAHNVLNASAAFNAVTSLRIPPEQIQESLERFSGVGRRMEKIGQITGADIYSDFGHHPTEIETTIQAFKKEFPEKKIWLIYQPHMFTRTKLLFDDFVKVFKGLPVEGTVIVDIYPSRELDTGQTSSEELVSATNHKNVEYIPSVEEIFNEIKVSLTKNDLVVFMGAGDIDLRVRKLLKEVK